VRANLNSSGEGPHAPYEGCTQRFDGPRIAPDLFRQKREISADQRIFGSREPLRHIDGDECLSRRDDRDLYVFVVELSVVPEESPIEMKASEIPHFGLLTAILGASSIFVCFSGYMDLPFAFRHILSLLDLQAYEPEEDCVPFFL
jgi:hypothetical protein